MSGPLLAMRLLTFYDQAVRKNNTVEAVAGAFPRDIEWEIIEHGQHLALLGPEPDDGFDGKLVEAIAHAARFYVSACEFEVSQKTS